MAYTGHSQLDARHYNNQRGKWQVISLTAITAAKNAEGNIANLGKELWALRKLRHPNCVTMLEVIEDETMDSLYAHICARRAYNSHSVVTPMTFDATSIFGGTAPRVGCCRVRIAG